MMLQSMLQILITVWIGVHPVTYTIPKQYTVDACAPAAHALFQRIRKGSGYKRIDIGCVPAFGSRA